MSDADDDERDAEELVLTAVDGPPQLVGGLVAAAAAGRGRRARTGRVVASPGRPASCRRGVRDRQASRPPEPPDGRDDELPTALRRVLLRRAPRGHARSTVPRGCRSPRHAPSSDARLLGSTACTAPSGTRARRTSRPRSSARRRVYCTASPGPPSDVNSSTRTRSSADNRRAPWRIERDASAANVCPLPRSGAGGRRARRRRTRRHHRRAAVGRHEHVHDLRRRR